MERWNTPQHLRMKANTLLTRSRGGETPHQGPSAFRRNITPISVSLTSIKHTELSRRTASGILLGQPSPVMDSGNGMPKRAPIVTRMDVPSRGFVVIVLVFFSLFASRCFAADRLPPTPICEVLRNIDAFDGRLIELHTDMRITMHGRYLIGKGCSELGSLGLVINNEEYKDKEVKEFVRKIYSGGEQSGLILIGYSSKATFDRFNGSFILKGVRSSRTRPKCRRDEGPKGSVGQRGQRHYPTDDDDLR